MKTFCFIELDFHAECLFGLTHIINQLKWSENICINIITKSEIFNLIKEAIPNDNKILWLLCPTKLSHSKCIHLHLSTIQQSDLVFINTLSQSIHAFLPIKGKKIVLRVHNTNKLFQPFSSLFWPTSFLDFKKVFKFLVKECLFNQYFSNLKKFKTMVDTFTFPENEMLRHALVRHKELTPENTLLLPMKTLDPENFRKNRTPSKEINFSITGNLHPYFRDVNIITNVLKRLSHINFTINIHIHFIGCGNYSQYIHPLKQIKNDRIKLNFLENRINQKEYNLRMEQSDCMICPLNQEFHVGAFKEYYGQTKITGNISDIAISPTPLIIPSFYFPNIADFPGIMQYGSENELFMLIKEIITQPEFLQQKKLEIERTAQNRYGLPTITSLYSKLLELSCT
jgi:hypothetical protein